MIAKFDTGDGWSFHDCTRALSFAKDVTIDEAQDARGIILGTGGVSPCKRVVLETPKGWQTIYYGKSAYLMNDNGKTICAL